MQTQGVDSTAELPKSNPFDGFWEKQTYQQNELLKEQFNQKLLCLDPRLGYTIISISGSNMGTILNPPSSSGMLSFFIDLNCAEQYIEARKAWFKKKDIPIGDVVIGKFCPADCCVLCAIKSQD
jgi:hypothetical protein